LNAFLVVAIVAAAATAIIVVHIVVVREVVHYSHQYKIEKINPSSVVLIAAVMLAHTYTPPPCKFVMLFA
jgi:hypothetical protein